MINYHIHTNLSDGKNNHEKIYQRAAECGLTEIGFSDHLCLKYPKWALQKNQFQIMIEKILNLKNLNSKNIKVKFGLEVDYLDGMENEIRNVLKLFPLDYVIGSVHYIKDWNFDTNKNNYLGKDIDQLYLDYFTLIQKAASSNLFDIMGHIDVVKKFNYYPSFKLSPFYEKTTKVFAESNVVFELNTSGKDKACAEFYPSDEFLECCFHNNVPVTLGSDSHKLDDLTRYYSEAILKLQSVGYQKLVVFENRKRSFVNI